MQGLYHVSYAIWALSQMSQKHLSIRFNCLFSLFLQYATNMPLTQKWKKPHLLLSKSFNQHKVCNLILGIFHCDSWPVLLHFKSILIVSQLKFRKETIPQSLPVLESRMTFDRQNFSSFVPQNKLFRNSNRLQIRKTSIYARIWISFWCNKQRWRPQKLTFFSIFTGSELTCRPLITQGPKFTFS